MSIEFSNTELTELTPKIIVIGVGGAGGNAVNNMIEAKLQGVDFVVANTDAQALSNSKTANRIQLGVESTRGLGAGAQPKVGEAAAEEALEEIEDVLNGAHMAFITAGMGGGTGTGAAPVVARAAKERGILTVGVVTKPFQFEGSRRMKMADAGLQALSEHVDALIIIPNQNLFCLATEKTTFADAFQMADQVLHSGVRGITDLIVMPGLINLDFADVRTVMSAMGKAMMGTGEAEGEGRAIEAAQAAIANPLLEDVSLNGARAVIINITGGMDMTLHEVDEAANLIRSQVDEDADIIVGSAFNQEMNGKIRVSVVATGIEGGELTYQRVEPSVVKPAVQAVPEAMATSSLDDAMDVTDEQEEMPADDETLTMDDVFDTAQDAPLNLDGAQTHEGEGDDWDMMDPSSDDDADDEDEDMPNNTIQEDAPMTTASMEEDETDADTMSYEVESEDDDPEEAGIDEEEILAANRDSAFFMDAHKEPGLSQMPTGEPETDALDAYAAEEEEDDDDDDDDEPEEKSGGLSFFRKLTASTRNAEKAKKDPSLASGGGTGDHGQEDKNSVSKDDKELEIPAFLRRQSN